MDTATVGDISGNWDRDGHSMRFEVNDLATNFGAEVIGLDLSENLTEEDFTTVQDLYFERVVVVFRGQTLTPS